MIVKTIPSSSAIHGQLETSVLLLVWINASIVYMIQNRFSIILTDGMLPAYFSQRKIGLCRWIEYFLIFSTSPYTMIISFVLNLDFEGRPLGCTGTWTGRSPISHVTHWCCSSFSSEGYFKTTQEVNHSARWIEAWKRYSKTTPSKCGLMASTLEGAPKMIGRWFVRQDIARNLPSFHWKQIKPTAKAYSADFYPHPYCSYFGRENSISW